MGIAMGSKDDRGKARRDLARINDRKRAERDAAIQRRLDEAAAQEAAQRDRDGKMDDAFLREAHDIFGLGLDELVDFVNEDHGDLVDGAEAKRVIREAKRQAKGGWLSKPNPRKAVKTLKGSKAVKKVAKAAKEKKDGCFGCAVVAVLILTGTAGSVVWGAVELVSALGV
jgi:hypothetical protein